MEQVAGGVGGWGFYAGVGVGVVLVRGGGHKGRGRGVGFGESFAGRCVL